MTTESTLCECGRPRSEHKTGGCYHEILDDNLAYYCECESFRPKQPTSQEVTPESLHAAAKHVGRGRRGNVREAQIHEQADALARANSASKGPFPSSTAVPKYRPDSAPWTTDEYSSAATPEELAKEWTAKAMRNFPPPSPQDIFLAGHRAASEGMVRTTPKYSPPEELASQEASRVFGKDWKLSVSGAVFFQGFLAGHRARSDQAAKARHGASGLCCQLREQEKQRADSLREQLDAAIETRDCLARMGNTVQVERDSLAAEMARLKMRMAEMERNENEEIADLRAHLATAHQLIVAKDEALREIASVFHGSSWIMGVTKRQEIATKALVLTPDSNLSGN